MNEVRDKRLTMDSWGRMILEKPYGKKLLDSWLNQLPLEEAELQVYWFVRKRIINLRGKHLLTHQGLGVIFDLPEEAIRTIIVDSFYGVHIRKTSPVEYFYKRNRATDMFDIAKSGHTKTVLEELVKEETVEKLSQGVHIKNCPMNMVCP